MHGTPWRPSVDASSDAQAQMLIGQTFSNVKSAEVGAATTT